MSSVKLRGAIIFGNPSEQALQHIKGQVTLSQSAGTEAKAKYQGLFGKDFGLGAVLQLPTTNAQQLLTNFSAEKYTENLPPFITLDWVPQADGLYAVLNANIAEVAGPFTEIKSTYPIKINIDVAVTKSGHEIATAVGGDTETELDVIASRTVTQLLTDSKVEVTVEIPTEAIGDLYGQAGGALPIPLPPVQNPGLFAKILQNFELQLNLDSHDTLPQYFKDQFYNEELVSLVRDVIRGFFEGLKEALIVENGHTTAQQISDLLEPKKAIVHVFHQNWGALSVEVAVPGLYSYMDKYIKKE